MTLEEITLKIARSMYADPFNEDAKLMPFEEYFDKNCMYFAQRSQNYTEVRDMLKEAQYV
jgi:hypothetical protein